MTSLSGIRVLTEGKDRLFGPMNKLILIADGLGIAIQIIVTGGGSIKMGGMPFGTSATSGQFPIIISFPYLRGPIVRSMPP